MVYYDTIKIGIMNVADAKALAYALAYALVAYALAYALAYA